MLGLINAQVNGKLGETEVRGYTRQIVVGLDYLHAKNVIHGYLCAKNVLVDAQGQLKLADYGISFMWTTLRKLNASTHMSPELIDPKYEHYEKSVDIW